MYKIRFGTDGWRAIIAQDFTVENVKRVAYATAQWVKNEAGKHADLKPAIVLGHDCRFGGEMFSLAVMQVMAHEGVHVMYHKGIATTPMVSLGTHDFKMLCWCRGYGKSQSPSVQRIQAKVLLWWPNKARRCGLS